MAVSREYQDHVAELLAPLGGIETKRMFGGAGLFYRDLMFALIADDVLYFKVDDETRPAFEAAGVGPFEYDTKNGRRSLAGYWRVPDEVLDDGDEIVAWGRRAADVALAADAAKPQGKRKGAKRTSTER
ncbi:MAG: TfoX/Sxy family protein [Alphaproteobacteria bacterium]